MSFRRGRQRPQWNSPMGWRCDELRASYIVRSRRFFELWPTSKAVYLPNAQMPAPATSSASPTSRARSAP
jgi:hypothetical protein